MLTDKDEFEFGTETSWVRLAHAIVPAQLHDLRHFGEWLKTWADNIDVELRELGLLPPEEAR